MKEIAIIGAGASGVVLAERLGRFLDSLPPRDRPFHLSLYEASEAPMRKLRATGNGRCNFTNSHLDVSHYTGPEAAFVEPCLTFDAQAARQYFADLGLLSCETGSGQVYPASLRADTLVDKLQDALRYHKIPVMTGYRLEDVQKRGASFQLAFEVEGKSVVKQADLLVLATGGAYGIGKKEWSCGYSLAKALGHGISRLHPGIVSLKLVEADWTRGLQGLKLEAGLTFRDETVVDDLLFTDYGISGLAVFRQSNRILDALQAEEADQLPICLDFLPQLSAADLTALIQDRQARFGDWTLSDAFNGLLARPLIDALLTCTGSDPSGHVKAWPQASASAFAQALKAFPLQVTGARHKDHGQVTCGGVLLDAVDPHTLESTLCPGLYFTGEILDVQGECGGYNLHWAWASAWAVAQAILRAYGLAEVSG